MNRRNFIQCLAGTIASVFLVSLNSGCNDGSDGTGIVSYPIDPDVQTTTTRMLSFPVPAQPSGPGSGTGLYPSELPLVNEYKKYGYGDWTYSTAGLEIKQRFDLMPDGYAATAASLSRLEQFARFFAMTDVHITDKEAPNQLIYLQQSLPSSGQNTSIYSPIMTCTHQVLDAAIQTINALHGKKAFDFGLSLGDVSNCASYNELRWYIDIIDGEVIRPSSGAHRGEGSIDYQNRFKAAGLDKSIPWYQVLGNHDHLFIGSFPVDADPSLGLRQSYLSDTVWAVPNAILVPNVGNFPVLFNMENLVVTPANYQGVLDGSTPTGKIIKAGPTEDFASPPKVVADPDRRALLRAEWIEEFFTTSSLPIGHGFDLVDPAMPEGFACYSFVPDPDVPLKIIVLDDTQSETDGSKDIHGHGFLDETRWAWLKDELAAGQDADQLMIIAAHIPIGVANIGSEMEWWESDKDPDAVEQNAVSLTELVETLWDTPNLIAWLAGHRHFNTVKAFVSPDPEGAPEKGFWQIETASLRDFPQQFRTFELYLNSDYSVSVETVNVDPSVAKGTPAAKSRYYSIAAQQIVQNDLRENNQNVTKAYGVIPVDTMDPSRPQDGTMDPTIEYGDVADVPYCASYNAELFKQLSPAMIDALMKKYPPKA